MSSLIEHYYCRPRPIIFLSTVEYEAVNYLVSSSELAELLRPADTLSPDVTRPCT